MGVSQYLLPTREASWYHWCLEFLLRLDCIFPARLTFSLSPSCRSGLIPLLSSVPRDQIWWDKSQSSQANEDTALRMDIQGLDITSSYWKTESRSLFRQDEFLIVQLLMLFYRTAVKFKGLYQPGKESVCSAGDPDSVPGSGRSPGEGNGYPHQYSCLENPMDRGALWAIVHGIKKSQTQLSNFHFTSYRQRE